MQESIRKEYKLRIKKGLEKLDKGCHSLFKRMYSHDNLERDINEVVDRIPDNKLDNALSQVERTINNISATSEVIEQNDCFVSDTCVATPEGLKKVKELRKGDLVYSTSDVSEMVKKSKLIKK